MMRPAYMLHKPAAGQTPCEPAAPVTLTSDVLKGAEVSCTEVSCSTLADTVQEFLLYIPWQFATLEHALVWSAGDVAATALALGPRAFAGADAELLLRLVGLALLLGLLYRLPARQPARLLIAGLAMSSPLLGLSPAAEHVELLMQGVLLGLLFVAGTVFSPRGWIEGTRPRMGTRLLAVAAVVSVGLVVMGPVSGSQTFFTGVILVAGLLLPQALSAFAAGSSRSRRGWNASVTAMATLLIIVLLPLLPAARQPAEVLSHVVALSVMVALAHIFALHRIPAWLARVERDRGPRALPFAVGAFGLAVVLTVALAGPGFAAGCFVLGVALGWPVVHPAVAALRKRTWSVLTAAYYVALGLLLDPIFVWRHAPWLLAVGVSCVLLGRADSKRTPGSVGRAVDVLPAGAAGLLVIYAGRAAGLSPAGLGVHGEQVFAILAAFLVLGGPLLGEIASRWRARSRAWKEPVPLGYQCQAPVTTGADLVHVTPGNARTTAPDRMVVRGRGKEPVGGPRLQRVPVHAGAPAEGLALPQLERWLLLRYQLTIVCVFRGDVSLLVSAKDACLSAGDFLVLSGCTACLRESQPLFSAVPPQIP